MPKGEVRRVDPLDRLVKLTVRVKRRHYETLAQLARRKGYLNLAGWLRALIAPHLN